MNPVYLNSPIKGEAFARYGFALLKCRGDVVGASTLANNLWPETPAIAACLKAVVPGGDPSTPGWASELASFGLADDFVSAVRARSVVDRLLGARRVPFRTSVPVETTGTGDAWVGAGVAIPVAKSQFASVAVDAFVAAVLVAVSNELLAITSPANVRTLHESMVAGVVRFLDRQFLDPSVAAVANVSPASITNGASVVLSTGASAAAMALDFSTMLDVPEDLLNPVWIAAPMTIARICAVLGLPDCKLVNGSLYGIPIIASRSTPAARQIVLLDQDAVLVADDGAASVDVSDAAALQMLDNPTNNSATGIATSMVSMFQTHATAARVSRRIAWRRTSAARVVYMLTAY